MLVGSEVVATASVILRKRVEMLANSVAIERASRRAMATEERMERSKRDRQRRQVNSNDVTRRMGGLGMAFAGGLGLGVAGGGALATAQVFKGAATDEWERDQLRVLGNITEEQMKAHQKVLDFVATRRGIGVAGANSVFGGLMSGGLDDKDAVAMTDNVVIFAKATKASVDDATRSTVALRNNMKISAADMMKAYDAIAVGGKAGQFEVEDMARNLPSLLAKMEKLGETGVTGVRNTVALAQAIRMTVGTSDEAATNYENMLDKFTSQDFVKNAGKFGINVEKTMKDANAKGISPVFALLQKIQQKTAGDPFKMSKLIPDRQASAAVLAVLKNMGFVLDTVKESERAAGSVMTDYETATNNASSAWSRFSENITTKAKGIAEVALPAVTAAMNKMSEAMENKETILDQLTKPSTKQLPDGAVSDETRNSWQGQMMEGLLGYAPSEKSKIAEAQRQYQNSRVEGEKIKAEADRKRNALNQDIDTVEAERRLKGYDRTGVMPPKRDWTLPPDAAASPEERESFGPNYPIPADNPRRSIPLPAIDPRSASVISGKVEGALSKDMGAAAASAMGGYNQKLTAEGQRAVDAVETFVREMKAKLNFSAGPTITPTFAPVAAPAAPAGGQQSSAAPTSTGSNVNLTQHIQSPNSRLAARAAQREQNRTVRLAQSRALHDLGSLV